MKRSLLYLMGLSLLLSLMPNGFSQSDDKKEKKSKTENSDDPNAKPMSWHIGLYGGLNHSYTDIRKREYFSIKQLGWNAGLLVMKMFNPMLGLRVQLGVGGTRGSADSQNFLNYTQAYWHPNLKGRPLRYKNFFQEGSLQLLINWSGITLNDYPPRVHKSGQRKFGFFSVLGAGLNRYEAKVYDLVTGDYLGGNWAIGAGWSGIMHDFAFIAGSGFSFKVSPKFHIDVEGGVRLLGTDKFDGVLMRPRVIDSNGPFDGRYQFGRDQDFYAYTNVNLVFALGKKGQTRSRYWNNPVLAFYQDMEKRLSEIGKVDLEPIKKQIDEKLADFEKALKTDTDNDGVPDLYDKEKNTRWDISGLKPSEHGWTAEEINALRDKANRNERILVDGSGIAMDIDRDGVPDHLDKCPFEPGSPQHNGCRVKPSAEVIKILTDLQHVEFEFDKDYFVDCSKKKSAALRDRCGKKQAADQANLKRLAEILNSPDYKDAKLRIEGHTDDRGTDEYNQDLSIRRANNIKNHLVKLGVDANRIKTIGKGEREPRVGPSGKNGTFTEFERDRNRRTEFFIE